MEIKILRQIDKLGRLVIPIDLRKQYGLNPKDRVYFTVREDGILIQPEDFSDDNNTKNQ